MKTATKKALFRAGTSISALIMAFSITATSLARANASKVHSFLGTSSTKLVSSGASGDTEYFKSDFATWEEQFEHAKQVNMDVQEEGSVLLENNGALPLSKGARVSLFSYSSTDIVYGGAGSGGIDTTNAPNLRQALEDADFQVNPALWDYYSAQEKPEPEGGSTGEGPQQRFQDYVFEPSVQDYPQEVLDSYADYSDAAIVVLVRRGGEGSDLDVANRYLELQDSERALLSHVQEKFGTVIVLLNTSNALAMDWIRDYDVDACLWIGGPGQEGLRAVAEMLCGARVPSGKLADTYAASSLSAPAMQNFGHYVYSNATKVDQMIDTHFYEFTNSKGETVAIKNAGAYVVEPEGIYVGYKYYETRYEDIVLGQGSASGSAGTFCSTGSGWNYADEVVYPFGYGLSYTQFEQKLDSVKADGDIVTVTATVTNKGGTYSGKDVVEVYAQAPYTPGGVEKASVQLCGFTKTEMLAPGQSQQVTVTVDMRDVASYDHKDAKTYILDKGDYYFAIGNGAHQALNNILALKGLTMTDGMDAEGDAALARSLSFSAKQYDTDSISGNPVSNLFDEADLNHYYEGMVTYLSRADWQGTWPKTYGEVEASDQMLADLENNYTARPAPVDSITYGADNGISLVALKDADFDDPRWEQLLDQLTLEEQLDLVTKGCEQTAPVMSIGFGGTVDKDGPGGLTGRKYLANPKDESTATAIGALGYNSSVVIASTWSQDMAFQRGASVGEDGLWTNTEGWWGPGGNTHRTPYSGRNFEYYSEDAYLGGMIGANDVAGGLSKGLRSFFKHFAANDQETNRHGLSTFVNEQALREIYFKQFQHVIQTGKAITLMESFNRIGCTWAGGCYALCTQLLRDEWGFVGNVETDLNFTDPEGWMNPRTGLAGGTDQWLMIGESNLGDYVKDNLDLAYEIRQASHRILYAASKTAAMNGMDESSTIVPVKAWWEITLYALDIVSALALAACIAGLFLLERKEKTALGSKPGVGFYLGCAGAVLAVAAVVGCAMLGGMVPEILLLILGIALFGAAVALKQQLLVLLSCFCYVGAGCAFLTHQLYTVTNVIAGIDATSFEGKFLVALVGVAAAILLGIAASIPALQKEQET